MEVEELAVDGGEEGEEGGGVGEFGVDAFFEDAEELGEGACEGLAGPLGARCAEEFGEDGADAGGEAGGGVFEDPETGEEGVDVCEGGGEGGEGKGGESSEFAFCPFHDDEDAVNVAVDVREELCELNGERLEGFAKVVEFLDDERSRGHVSRADALAEIPDCDAGFLQIPNLLHAILRIEDERFEGPGEACDLDKIRYRRLCWRLEE